MWRALVSTFLRRRSARAGASRASCAAAGTMRPMPLEFALDARADADASPSRAASASRALERVDDRLVVVERLRAQRRACGNGPRCASTARRAAGPTAPATTQTPARRCRVASAMRTWNSRSAASRCAKSSACSRIRVDRLAQRGDVGLAGACARPARRSRPRSAGARRGARTGRGPRRRGPRRCWRAHAEVGCGDEDARCRRALRRGPRSRAR